MHDTTVALTSLLLLILMAPLTYGEYHLRTDSLPDMPLEPESQPGEEEHAEYTAGGFAAAIAAPVVIFICVVALLITFHIMSRQPSPRRTSRKCHRERKHRTWYDPETIQTGRMSSVVESTGNDPDTASQANSGLLGGEVEPERSFDHTAPSQATTVSTVPSASNSLVRLPGHCAHPA